MSDYGWDYGRRESRQPRTVSEMGEWRGGAWVWYGDRSDPLNGRGYGSEFRRPGLLAPRRDPRRRYDQGYGTVAYRPGAGGFYGGPGYASTGYDRAYGGQRTTQPGDGYDMAWRGMRHRGLVSVYDRGYYERFRRPPEGAELKEFRRGEMGHLWDR